MSGHSKWSTIKHKKAATDAKRGQIFSKLSKNITLAAQRGADPKANAALATAIEQARAENMPKDNIDRAIKKVAEKSAAQLQEISVDALGPGGVALRIKGVTDNSNRTISEIKKILTDHGAKMVQPGSIAWMFGTPLAADADTRARMEKLFEALDDQDDIDDVDSNLADEPAPRMIALGIDPGSTRIGWGVVKHEGSRLECIAWGTIENTNHNQSLNLRDTETGLIKVIEAHKPDCAGIERLFFTNNKTTAMAVSETRGVLLLTLSKHGLPIQEFTPNQVKQMVTSYGGADKKQVYKMVQLLLNVKEPITPDDAVDALAIAICCSHTIIPYK